ncbi:unnamed protein product, partial [Ascophyllum nodosum]
PRKRDHSARADRCCNRPTNSKQSRTKSKNFDMGLDEAVGKVSGGDTSSSAWDVHQDRDEIDLAGPEDDQESSDVGISNVRRERASSLASSRSSGKNKPTDKEEGAHRGRDCRAGPVGNDSGWRYDRARREPSPISGRVVRHDSHNDRPARSPSRGQPYRGRWNWPQD